MLLLGILASGLGSAAVFLKRSRDLRGTLDGLPDPALAARPAILGVNADLNGQGDPARTAAEIKAAGFDWVRQAFYWPEIEPLPASYDWSKADSIVEAASGQSLGLIATLLNAPDWSHRVSPDPTAPPDSPTAFADFASAFAARYAKQIDVYQVWDEPNLALGWGGRIPNPAGYAALLEAAYLAIHAADHDAIVLAAGLAPTTETGPDNLSDLIYLDELYKLGAASFFDAAAGKPYGFNLPPTDRAADPAILNFSRLVLLREVMERHGDGAKLLWASHFGWNALPPGWTGPPSLWGQVTVAEQAIYTVDAFRRAAQEWPWAGVMVLESWTPPKLPRSPALPAVPADDPRWGFALVTQHGERRPVLSKITGFAALTNGYAQSGNHFAIDPAAMYSGPWEFSELGADIPENYVTARIMFSFEGTDLALKLRRADYRGYLYITVDGQPANLLPRDERGSYLVLTSPDLASRIDTVPVARDLPGGRHTAEIIPERGWDQWAIAGFSVGTRTGAGSALILGSASGILAILLIGAAILTGREQDWGWPIRMSGRGLRRLGHSGQLALGAILSLLLYLAAALTLGGTVLQVTRKGGDGLPLVLTALTAGLFYYSPWLLVSLAALAGLFLLFCTRLDLAFALIAFFIPFYLQPKPLFDRAFSMVELLTVLSAAAWLLQVLQRSAQRTRRTIREVSALSAYSAVRKVLSTAIKLDLAMVAFLLVAAASLFTAELKGVAIREFRLVVLEPVVFYALLRATPLRKEEILRIMDFLILGAVVVAGIGLYQYFSGANLITAEGGLQRLRSVYGSPNNVGLYLGRAVGPIAAMALMGRNVRRRWLYAIAGLPVVVALGYTESRGALLLGVPAALAVVLVLWAGSRLTFVGRRQTTLAPPVRAGVVPGAKRSGATALHSLGAGRRFVLLVVLGLLATGVVLAAALVRLSRSPRFTALLDLQSGTSFFRLRLWQSALAMIRDHPLLGVGLDNFLYAYRGKYILPEAWQDPNLSHPHNFLLDYAARLGLLGLAAGIALQAAFWTAIVRAYRHLADPDLRALAAGLMASMASFLAHGLVDNSYFLVDLAFVFALTLGLAHHLSRAAESRVAAISIAEFAESAE